MQNAVFGEHFDLKEDGNRERYAEMCVVKLVAKDFGGHSSVKSGTFWIGEHV